MIKISYIPININIFLYPWYCLGQLLYVGRRKGQLIGNVKSKLIIIAFLSPSVWPMPILELPHIYWHNLNIVIKYNLQSQWPTQFTANSAII